MSNRPTSPDLPIDLEALAEDLVDQALAHEDPRQSLDWLLAHFSDYLEPTPFADESQNELMTALALMVGHALWNVLPLPGNRFRPQPLPKPQRNDPCPCGSGRKFKQCCGRFWRQMPLPEEMLWPLVLDRVGPKAALAAHARGEVPASALLNAAEHYWDYLAKPTKGIRFLEPLFDPPPTHPEPVHADAADLLFNLYDQVHRPRKKQQLLDRLLELPEASPLRAAAHRRRAMIRMDQDNAEEAWRHLEQARRDDPDASDLGMLEVQLLLAENRIQQAADRAGFWLRRLSRVGLPKDDPMLEFLQRISVDPLTAMSELSAEAGNGGTGRLLHWLKQVNGRPLPDYRIESADAPTSDAEHDDPTAGMHDLLRNMGIPENQIQGAADQLRQQFDALRDREPDDDEETEPETPPGVLIAPASIARLNTEWSRVFTLSKPYSIQDSPMDSADPWSRSDRWLNFLEQHPEAFDSIDILDDLVTALLLTEEAYTPWQIQTHLLPLLERVRAIVERALAGQDEPRLEWIMADNRPALRSLARLVRCELQRQDTDAAMALAERLLELNPNDNHGFRQLLINHHLRTGDDHAALALIDRYPEDASPEFMLGQALALYRTGRRDEADEVLADAITMMPTATDMLWRKRVRQPPTTEWVTVGSEEEGWQYRQEMRPVWETTPGALDWLRRMTKQVD